MLPLSWLWHTDITMRQYSLFENQLLFFKTFQIQSLHLFARPLGFAQKFEARVEARVFVKTIDAYALIHYFPAIHGHEVFQYIFERNAV